MKYEEKLRQEIQQYVEGLSFLSIDAQKYLVFAMTKPDPMNRKINGLPLVLTEVQSAPLSEFDNILRVLKNANGIEFIIAQVNDNKLFKKLEITHLMNSDETILDSMTTYRKNLLWNKFTGENTSEFVVIIKNDTGDINPPFFVRKYSGFLDVYQTYMQNSREDQPFWAVFLGNTLFAHKRYNLKSHATGWDVNSIAHMLTREQVIEILMIQHLSWYDIFLHDDGAFEAALDQLISINYEVVHSTSLHALDRHNQERGTALVRTKFYSHNQHAPLESWHHQYEISLNESNNTVRDIRLSMWQGDINAPKPPACYEVSAGHSMMNVVWNVSLAPQMYLIRENAKKHNSGDYTEGNFIN